MGPTATGKTDLALILAKKYNGELVACDSRQVYVGLDIGTGKLPSKTETSSEILRYAEYAGQNDEGTISGYWIIDGVKIWLYDVVDPKTQYTVADYVKEATRVINDITKRGKLPIIVGGTGLYLEALLQGLSNLSVPIDQKLRKELAKMSVGELQEKLQFLSPGQLEALNESDRQNPRRLIRKIELSSIQPMNPYMGRSQFSSGLEKNFNVLKIGLTAPREVLYKNIDLRVLSRLNQGMIQEAEELHSNGLTLERMRQLGLEYGVLADFLEGHLSKDEMITVMQGKIHDYLRRQQTWFKKENNVHWVDISDQDYMKQVEKLLIKW